MKSTEFSLKTRRQDLERLPQEVWDLVVIGGGATGAACARDAALRGLKCVLLESQDFASGTSSGSSKLIHGGVRYLEQKEFGLVYHAIQERELLKKLYAPLVQDIDFIFPTYRGRFPPKFLLNIGLSLYDAFSFFKKRHASLSRKEVRKQLPFLRSENLTGALIYQDSFTEDYRLVIEMIKSARKAGAFCFNRLSFEGLNSDSKSAPFSIKARDKLSGREIVFQTKSLVNCTGPFSDAIKKSLNLPGRLHLTQGVHFVLNRDKLPLEKACVLSDPENNRILFAIPWQNVSYLGTTDTDISDPHSACATKADLDYVLSVANRYFEIQIKAEDILQSWAAVRPLIQPDAAESNSEISREHQIEESHPGFFHVLGGKLTSHRLMAEEAVDLICKHLKLSKKSPTASLPLQGDRFRSSKPSRLELTYGVYAHDIDELDDREGLSNKVISRQLPHRVSEILYAIRYEAALEPLDFLRRRSSVYYESGNPEVAEAVAKVFQKELGWSDAEYQEALLKTFDSYRRDQQAFSS